MSDKGHCPWCGAEIIDEDATYCGTCGRPLGSEGTTELPSKPASASEQRRPRRFKIAVIVSCATIVASLVIIAMALSYGGSQGADAGDSEAVNQQAAEQSENESESEPTNGGDDGSDEDTSASDTEQAAEVQSDQDRVVSSLDGWWTTVGNRPYNYYVRYEGGSVSTYSSEGALVGSNALDVSVSATTGDEANFGPWKILDNGGDSSQFLILSADANTLYDCWTEGSRVQYSMSDSLIRCGAGQNDPLPSFASAASGSGGDTIDSAGDGFESVVPEITGWDEQPVPGAPQTSGIIWRVSWSPVEGAEGYEVRNWSQEGTELYEDQPKTVTTAYCDLSGSGISAFAAQVRAYRTEGGTRVYSQWSARSEHQVA